MADDSLQVRTLTPYTLPHWHDNRQLLQTRCPPQLRRWLFDRGSLTRRLIARSNGDFSVRLLRQAWGKPRLDEAQALDIPPHQYALIREVLLCGHNQPWVYARSVLPQQTLQGSLRFLRKLDNRPLGQLLFTNPQIRRGAISAAQWQPQLLPAFLQSLYPEPLWARRSVFHYRNTGILVAELFLPAVIA